MYGKLPHMKRKVMVKASRRPSEGFREGLWLYPWRPSWRPSTRPSEGLQKDVPLLPNYFERPSRRSSESLLKAFKKGWISFERPCKGLCNGSTTKFLREGLQKAFWKDVPRVLWQISCTRPSHGLIQGNVLVRFFWKAFRRPCDSICQEFSWSRHTAHTDG